ncbi:hypothetical protein GIB67_002783, partial [Kingdonia uniflora]
SSSLAHLGSNLGLGDPRLLFTSVVVGAANFGHGERVVFPSSVAVLGRHSLSSSAVLLPVRVVVVIDFWMIGFRWWWCL